MKRDHFLVLLIMLIFVAISFVTNIIDPMGSDVQASFGLTNARLGYMATALFIAYAVMSIPAGMLVERFAAKPVLLSAFGLSCLGAFAYAFQPSYAVALPSLFVIGAGFAMLQVIINPLLRVAGGEEHYAFYGNMSQMIFALGSTVSPYLYGYLVGRLKDPGLSRNPVIGLLERVVKPGLPWVSLYWVFAIVLLAMVVVVSFVKLPAMRLNEDEKVGSFDTILPLLGSRTVWLYFVGIVCYVGTEQGVAVWIKRFLLDYHRVDPGLVDKVAVAGFWGAMTLGCAVSLVLLKLFDSRRILGAFFTGGAITLLAALFGSRSTALVGLPLMGFWCSVGWPIIFSLALNSVEKHHGPFAGILCTGIVGGAILPPLIGKLGDHFGLRLGMLALLGTFAYIIGIAFWARPLIANATLGKTKEPLPENV